MRIRSYPDLIKVSPIMKDHMVLKGICAGFAPSSAMTTVWTHMRERGRPGEAALPSSPQAGLDRKALQLCHQVAETLEEVLAECGDGLLQALRVLDVEPAPDASRLLVTLAVDGLPREELDLGRVHDHLAARLGPPPQRGGDRHHSEASSGPGLSPGRGPRTLSAETCPEVTEAGRRSSRPAFQILHLHSDRGQTTCPANPVGFVSRSHVIAHLWPSIGPQ